MEATARRFSPPLRHVATGTRGLQRVLRGQQRPVVLRLEETIMTATPPLASGYGPKGQQGCVPLTGHRAQRVVHGARTMHTGALLLFITDI